MDRNTLLKSSRATFISIFDELMEVVIHQSIETLFEKADKSLNSQEQRQLLDARSFIARNEQALKSQITNNLDILLDRSFQTAYDTFRPSFFNSAKTSPLVLLDISTFEDDLRLDLITSNFRSEAGVQLRDLTIRIAILFERDDIIERENPFRPYLLTRAIVLGVEATHVDSNLFVIITEQFAEGLLRKVVKLYEGVNKHLSESGVAAQLQHKPRKPYSANNNSNDEDAALAKLMQARSALKPNSTGLDDKLTELAVLNQFARIEQLLSSIKLAPQKKTQITKTVNNSGFPEINTDLLADSDSPDNGTKAGGLGATVSGWLEGVQEVGETLRRFFLGETQNAATEIDKENGTEGSSLSDQANTISISPKLNTALQTPLPPMNEMMMQDGIVRNLLIETRDQLNSLTSDQHEKMTIDIVAMLFEFILNDHQVPAEVRAQLGRLQFSVLKMALMDSALLTKKSHPARLLVNRIGSISVGLQQVDPSGERISKEICLIVEELLANDAESPELFSKMLDKLDGFIARELLASNTSMENAVNVVVNAENRSKRFELISEQLEKILINLTVTPNLKQFLLDTWSHAIERTERNSDVPATRFRLLVPNLVWSVLPKVDQEERYLLLQILPSFVAILREGMNLVGWSPEQQQELLNWLVDIHTTVMRDEADKPSEANEISTLSLLEVQKLFHEFTYPDELSFSESAVTKNINVPRSFVEEAIKEYEMKSQADIVIDDLDKNPKLFSTGDLSDEASKEWIAKLNSDPNSYFHSLSEDDYSDDESDSDAMSENDDGNGVENKEEDILDRLRSGVVVEINLSGSPTLGRLNWISPNSTNLILTMHGEEAPSVISVRMFRRMLKSSRARFVEVAPLFERAVQSLLESADLVDLAHSS
jgi:hypothetical protein